VAFLIVFSIGPSLKAEEIKERFVLQGHEQTVYCVAFGPDGKTLASGGLDRRAILWDLASGKKRATLAHSGFVYGLAFAPGGKILATGSGQYDNQGKGEPGEIKLWDVSSGRLRATLKGFPDQVLAVAFSPDGKTVAGGGMVGDPKTGKLTHGEVRLWEVSSGRLRATLKAPLTWVNSLAFAPDGKTLASGGLVTSADSGQVKSLVKLWNVPTSKERATLTGDVSQGRNDIRSLTFTPDGKTLIAGNEQEVRLWDVGTGKELARVPEASDPVMLLSGGKWLVTGGRKDQEGKPAFQLKRWDLSAGSVSPLPAPGILAAGLPDSITPGFRPVALDGFGKVLVTGHNDGTVRLWDLTDKMEGKPLKETEASGKDR
jgi:WD40 repeat protein